MVDHEPFWLVGGAVLLFALDLAIQRLYQYYLSRRVLTLKEKSAVSLEEPVLRKMSKLVRCFSSSFVQFECPRKIPAGKESSAQLSIQSVDDLAKQFGYDDDVKLTVRPEVKANLSGDHFSIKLNTDAAQCIGDRNLVWNWTVRSLKGGRQRLALHLVFDVQGALGKQEHNLWLDERVIEVSSNWLYGLRLWCSAKWRSAVAVGLEITVFYLLLKFAIGLG